MVEAGQNAGALLREARRRARLTQAQLGRRAGITQSVVSAYESGARQPSLATLQRLVAATGLQLSISVQGPASLRSRLTGPLGRRVLRRRRQIKQIAARHGADDVRVFGSVARGEDTTSSDVDLLVDLSPDVGLLGLGRLEHELSELLHATVEVVPAIDLKPEVARDVRLEALTL
jgi:predicted nucleotidyltransferase/DNA-binding XRE family transcriptional regulator